MKTEADNSACCKICVTLEIQGDFLQLNTAAQRSVILIRFSREGHTNQEKNTHDVMASTNHHLCVRPRNVNPNLPLTICLWLPLCVLELSSQSNPSGNNITSSHPPFPSILIPAFLYLHWISSKRNRFQSTSILNVSWWNHFLFFLNTNPSLPLNWWVREQVQRELRNQTHRIFNAWKVIWIFLPLL